MTSTTRWLPSATATRRAMARKPLGLGTAGTYDIQPFMSSEGVLPGYVDVDGKRTIPYATEAAIPVYEFLAKLYTEGLYDPNFATATTADFRNLFMTDKIEHGDLLGHLGRPVQRAGPRREPGHARSRPWASPPPKDRMARSSSPAASPSVWTIPVNAPDPDTAFKFIEWWHTIPGDHPGVARHPRQRLHRYAMARTTLTELGTEHAMDHGDPTPYNSNWVNPIGELPGLKDAQEITKAHGYLAVQGADWGPTIDPILSENIIKIILGDMTAAEGVQAMQDDPAGQGPDRRVRASPSVPQRGPAVCRPPLPRRVSRAVCPRVFQGTADVPAQSAQLIRSHAWLYIMIMPVIVYFAHVRLLPALPGRGLQFPGDQAAGWRRMGWHAELSRSLE